MSKITIINYGSQYTRNILALLHELGFDALILDPDAPWARLKNSSALILSGSPFSVYDQNAPQLSKALLRLMLELNTPTLAICYGLQALAQHTAKDCYPAVKKRSGGEFGKATLNVSHKIGVLKGLKNKDQVWMSHGDFVELLPPGFQLVGSTKDCRLAAIQHNIRPIFGVQFHPEVTQTLCGKQILQNFLDICGAEPNWDQKKQLSRVLRKTRRQIGDKIVLAPTSCGNDSSVLAKMLQKIVPPERLFFIYIRGLAPESDVKKTNLVGGKFLIIDGSKRFFRELKDVVGPREKRLIIRRIYEDLMRVEIDKLAKKLALTPEHFVLAQGTIAPDVIESREYKQSAEIKPHHNIGLSGFTLVEPLRDFFKEDGRAVGRILGVHEQLITQYPSPGPHDAIRILCHDSNSMPSDETFHEAMRAEPEINALAQKHDCNAWVLPIRSTGIQGDEGSYCYSIGLLGPYRRAPLLELATEIPNRFKRKINRVVYVVAPSDTRSLMALGLKKDYFRPKTKQIVDAANAILEKNLHIANLYHQISQAFIVIAPLSFSTRGYAAVIRAVDTHDFMTASCHWLPGQFLRQTAEEIMAKVPEIELVLYDLTSKPPGTIEWE